ncbi:hypothetical protein [Ekhidna sp.]|uniref:hypothetical protein n=1 Tax=Ekhidna sp. TaxID=2608089 RepID=UPI003296B9FF
MKKITEILKVSPWVALSAVIVLIAIPFLIFLFPFFYIQNIRFENSYKNYLDELEGKSFFCYNNRLKGRSFIEEQLIPQLPDYIEVIFLNGMIPESQYEEKYISHALYQLKNYQRFPQLLKIRGGQTYDKSLNNELFNTMEQNKPLGNLLTKMSEFFEVNGDEKEAA